MRRHSLSEIAKQVSKCKQFKKTVRLIQPDQRTLARLKQGSTLFIITSRYIRYLLNPEPLSVKWGIFTIAIDNIG